MALQWIWIGMAGASVFFAMLNGRAPVMLEAALRASADAISLTISLGAGYLFFCGWIGILRALHAPQGLERLLRPALARLLPYAQGEQARQAVSMNLSMNMLGLGNAATPQGIEAMRLLDAERRERPRVAHDMYMLLILNATSIQLIPTTVLALRVAAGTADANAVIVPTLLCTALSTAVGAGLGLACRRVQEARHA